MLEHFFHSPTCIARLRGNPGVTLLDAFAGHLIQCGYQRGQGGRHLRAAAHLLHWFDRRRLPLTEIDAAVMSGFVRHLKRCRCAGFADTPRDRTLRGVRAFTAYLQGRPLCIACHGQPDEVPSALWESFCKWMREQRGVTERTLRDYHDCLHRLLLDVGDETNKLDAAYLQHFILDLGRNGGNERVKSTTTALRMFIRFLIAQGQCLPGLDEAIPSVAGMTNMYAVPPPSNGQALRATRHSVHTACGSSPASHGMRGASILDMRYRRRYLVARPAHVGLPIS